ALWRSPAVRDSLLFWAITLKVRALRRPASGRRAASAAPARLPTAKQAGSTADGRAVAIGLRTTSSPPWVRCLRLPGVNYGQRSMQPASAMLQVGSKRLLEPGGLAARGWTDPGGLPVTLLMGQKLPRRNFWE